MNSPGTPLYFAGPLFTPAERDFNERLARKLAGRFDVFLPQRDGLLLPGMEIAAVDYPAIARNVFEGDFRAIRSADVLFAVLDGRTVDEGVAVEIGIAYALGKRCIAFHSDARVLLPNGINPMVGGAIHTLLRSESELDRWLSTFGHTQASG